MLWGSVLLAPTCPRGGKAWCWYSWWLICWLALERGCDVDDAGPEVLTPANPIKLSSERAAAADECGACVGRSAKPWLNPVPWDGELVVSADACCCGC